MKKITLLFIFINSCICPAAFAQCVKEQIRTDPQNPYNSENPAKTNDFDWTAPNFDLNSSAINLNSIPSPFFQGDNEFINHLVDSKDRLPINGWELIKKDFGYTGNGAVDYPYLVLYNRYTATLRVFAAMKVIQQGYSAARFTLRFVNGSDKIRVVSTFAKPLDQLIEIDDNMIVASGFNNGDAKWFYADFTMNYDPCPCSVTSKLIVEIELIDQANIQMSGVYEGTLTAIENNSGEVRKSSGLSLNPTNLHNSWKKGQETYKTISSFANENLKTAISEMPYWDDIFSDLEATHGVGFDIESIEISEIETLLNTYNVQQEFAKHYNKYTKYKEGLGFFEEALGESSFLRGTLQAVPFIGAAVSFIDAFIGGGQKPPGPLDVKLTPTAINMTSEYTGTISTNHDYKHIIFYTPGTDPSNIQDDGEYPYYNHALGVFNLMKTPEILTHYQYSDLGWILTVHLYDDQTSFKFNDELEYIINPAAGLRTDNVEIFGSLIFKNNGTLINQTEFVPIGCLNNFAYRFGNYFTYSKGFGFYPGGLDHPTEVDLKILVNLERLDADEHTQNVLIVQTYPLNVVQTGTPLGGSDLFAIEKDIVLDGELVSTDKEAIHTILVDNNTTFGSDVNLTAGREIKVLPGVTITPGVTIKTGVPSSCEGIILTPPPATLTEVANYCSITYNGGNSAKIASNEEIKGGDNIAQNGLDDIELTTNLLAYPNPALNMVTLRYEVETLGRLQLTISDLSGKNVISVIDKQDHQTGTFEVTFDTSKLQKGVYLYTLRAEDLTTSKKLIILE